MFSTLAKKFTKFLTIAPMLTLTACVAGLPETELSSLIGGGGGSDKPKGAFELDHVRNSVGSIDNFKVDTNNLDIQWPDQGTLAANGYRVEIQDNAGGTLSDPTCISATIAYGTNAVTFGNACAALTDGTVYGVRVYALDVDSVETASSLVNFTQISSTVTPDPVTNHSNPGWVRDTAPTVSWTHPGGGADSYIVRIPTAGCSVNVSTSPTDLTSAGCSFTLGQSYTVIIEAQGGGQTIGSGSAPFTFVAGSISVTDVHGASGGDPTGWVIGNSDNLVVDWDHVGATNYDIHVNGVPCETGITAAPPYTSTSCPGNNDALNTVQVRANYGTEFMFATSVLYRKYDAPTGIVIVTIPNSAKVYNNVQTFSFEVHNPGGVIPGIPLDYVNIRNTEGVDGGSDIDVSSACVVNGNQYDCDFHISSAATSGGNFNNAGDADNNTTTSGLRHVNSSALGIPLLLQTFSLDAGPADHYYISSAVPSPVDPWGCHLVTVSVRDFYENLTADHNAGTFAWSVASGDPVFFDDSQCRTPASTTFGGGDTRNMYVQYRGPHSYAGESSTVEVVPGSMVMPRSNAMSASFAQLVYTVNPTNPFGTARDGKIDVLGNGAHILASTPFSGAIITKAPGSQGPSVAEEGLVFHVRVEAIDGTRKNLTTVVGSTLTDRLNIGDEIMWHVTAGNACGSFTVGDYGYDRVININNGTRVVEVYEGLPNDDSTITGNIANPVTSGSFCLIQITRVPNIDILTLANNTGDPILGAPGYNGISGGSLVMRARRVDVGASVATTAIITASAKGFRGGDQINGESEFGLPASRSAAAIGVGGGSFSSSGGGGGGSAGTGGNGMTSIFGGLGWSSLTRLFFGGGGGGAIETTGTADGGDGGGILKLFVDEIEDISGVTLSIVSDGQNGLVDNSTAAGGGGGGGDVHLSVKSVDPTDLYLTAFGGNGGLFSPAGGSGGGGKISIETCSGTEGQFVLADGDVDGKSDSVTFGSALAGAYQGDSGIVAFTNTASFCGP